MPDHPSITTAAGPPRRLKYWLLALAILISIRLGGHLLIPTLSPFSMTDIVVGLLFIGSVWVAFGIGVFGLVFTLRPGQRRFASVALIGLSAPWTPWYWVPMKLEFEWHHASRVAIVEAVLDDRLPIATGVRENDGLVRFVLPPEARHLATDRQVILNPPHEVDWSQIVFVQHYGLLGRYTGWLWSSDRGDPRERPFGFRCESAVRMGPHWWSVYGRELQRYR